eukprot:jgi/Antlo1/1232/2278
MLQYPIFCLSCFSFPPRHMLCCAIVPASMLQYPIFCLSCFSFPPRHMLCCAIVPASMLQYPIFCLSCFSFPPRHMLCCAIVPASMLQYPIFCLSCPSFTRLSSSLPCLVVTTCLVSSFVHRLGHCLVPLSFNQSRGSAARMCDGDTQAATYSRHSSSVFPPRHQLSQANAAKIALTEMSVQSRHTPVGYVRCLPFGLYSAVFVSSLNACLNGASPVAGACKFEE